MVNYNVLRLYNSLRRIKGVYPSINTKIPFGKNDNLFNNGRTFTTLNSPNGRYLIDKSTPLSATIDNGYQLNDIYLSRPVKRRFSTRIQRYLKNKNVSRLFELLWPTDTASKNRIIVSILFLILSKISVVGIPLFLSSLIDSVCKKHEKIPPLITNLGIDKLLSPELMLPQLYLLGYVLSRILSSLFSELRNSLFSSVTEKVGRLNASTMFMKIHNLDIDFLLSAKSGEISAMFSRGIRAISQILRIIVFQVVPTLFEFTLVTGLLCYKVGPAVATITALTMAFYLIFTALVTKWRMVIRRNMVDADQKSVGVFVDSISNAEAVRYYNSQTRELERYSTQQCNYETHAVDVQKSLALLNFGQQFIFNLGLLSSLWITLSKMSSGVSDIILVNTLLFQLAIPLNMIGTMYREIKLSFIDLQKFLDLLNIQPNVYDFPNARDLIVKNGKIEFRNVHYSYNSSHKILDDFSLIVNPGKTVAIVGDSGTGKSTISKLLFRFYDPPSGQILIDDQDIKYCTLHSLRSALGIVPQDVVLFNETVMFNILYGNIDATPEQEAAKLAGIHDTIMSLDDGYDTLVGERGMKLSGGEKQRIGIARCFLKDPKILIFDEATSSLDFRAEDKIIKAFKSLSANKSTIIIAHRLSSMINADEIVVFRDGRIVEHGTPYELIKRQNSYLKQVIDSQKIS